MKLSFSPGNLQLESDQTGVFHLMLHGEEVFHSRSQRAAVAKFNTLRQELEQRFPAHEQTREQKAEAFRTMLKDSLVQHNSVGGRKKKTSAGGTRTFGG